MQKNGNSRYQIVVNNVHEFDLDSDDTKALDATEDSSNEFHVLMNQKAYVAKIADPDYEQKKVNVLVNGNTYEVNIADKFDQLVEKMGLSSYPVNQVKDIKAPMPGLVLEIAVSPDQQVESGDKLLILEAMKMENVIRAEGSGKVKIIHIEKGAAVDKGQLMIEME